MTPERPGVLAAIGNTSIVRLGRLVEPGIAVSTGKAFETARRAARSDGVWGGPSTGASLDAALTVARRLGPEAWVVAIQLGSGLKYLAGDLYS